MSETISLSLQPKLGSAQHAALLSLCRKVSRKLAATSPTGNPQHPADYFRDLARRYSDCPSTRDLKFLVCLHVIADLLMSGWRLAGTGHGQVRFSRPAENGSGPSKDEVRQAHLVERDLHLRKPSICEFIRDMERYRLTPQGWHSIYSVMRDGGELAKLLSPIAALPDENERVRRLVGGVSPYIQFVESGALCKHTGLPLGDIWRYFRHTWVNVPKSIPGRSMMILVRDAAVVGHPIIGIAALGSSVVQQAARDAWIGWDAKGALERLGNQPCQRTVAWLNAQLKRLISEVYVKDLKNEGLLTRQEINCPDEDAIARLRREAGRAIKRHRKFPQKALHKSGHHIPAQKAEWEERANSFLFRSKRCKTLAVLLEVRRTFQQHLKHGPTAEVARALEGAPVRAGIARVVRLIKAEHVGNDMMDITVCGALPPYSHLLGGKLVCLLLCSQEVVKYYAKRYRSQASVIASSMRGKPVRRRSKLVLLCTTSLYGTGSSQYNRIKAPCELIGGESGEYLQYVSLGVSEGFGSFHISRETVDAMNILVGRSNGGRRVNSIFGEGVNPLIRKIREALEIVGLPSDALLRHGNRRIVFGIPLAKNFREVLLGLQKRPRYLIPLSHANGTALLSQYWLRRWLARRIAVPGILEHVTQHTLACPVRHGARVPLSPDDHETLPPWPLHVKTLTPSEVGGVHESTVGRFEEGAYRISDSHRTASSRSKPQGTIRSKVLAAG